MRLQINVIIIRGWSNSSLQTYNYKKLEQLKPQNLKLKGGPSNSSLQTNSEQL
jgi:hypothetical protein